MMEFRRWLKRQGACVIAGALSVSGLAGCQTESGAIRNYAPDAAPAQPAPLIVPQPADGVTAAIDVVDEPEVIKPNLPPPPPIISDEDTSIATNDTASDATGTADINKPTIGDSVTETPRVAVVDEPEPVTNNEPESTDVAATDPVKSESEPIDPVFVSPIEVADTGTSAVEPNTTPEVPNIEEPQKPAVATPAAVVEKPVVTDSSKSNDTAVPLIDLPNPAPATGRLNEPAAVPAVEATETREPETDPVTTPTVEEPEPTIALPEATPEAAVPVIEEDQFVAVEKPDTPTAADGFAEPDNESGIQVISEQRLPVFHVAADSDGNLFLSQRDAILKVTPDGKSQVWSKLRAPRGHVVLADGSHVVCVAGMRAVVRLDADGEISEELASGSDGIFLRSPSHVVADGHGGFYFSDPGYARIRNPIGNVHHISEDGKVSVVAQRLGFPEGIALSPDGSKLRVVESQLNRIVEFEVLAPGKLGQKRVLARLPKKSNRDSDDFAHTLTTDSKGRLFVAHGGTEHVEVIDNDGNVSERHHLPGVIASGVAFMPGETDRLFVAGTTRNSRRGRVLKVNLD